MRNDNTAWQIIRSFLVDKTEQQDEAVEDSDRSSDSGSDSDRNRDREVTGSEGVSEGGRTKIHKTSSKEHAYQVKHVWLTIWDKQGV